MVDPSPPLLPAAEKTALRRTFRQARAAHVTALPERLRALMLSRPPAPVAAMIAPGSTIGLYYPLGAEAPATGWCRWFHENGHGVALPWFSGRDAAMTFRLWENPHDEDSLSSGPFGALQPPADAPGAVPDVLVVPLVAFTAEGHRLGQGGGHYDRWLADHPGVPAIGLAWDCQIAEQLPCEPHDRLLAAVVTPTRIYERGPHNA